MSRQQAPVRLQRTRKKGGGNPPSPNGLPNQYVGRPTIYGNMYDARVYGHRRAVEKYAEAIDMGIAGHPGIGQPLTRERIRRELAGKNLVCWCSPEQVCHADVLLKIANAPAF